MSTMIITTVYSNAVMNFVYLISFMERQLVQLQQRKSIVVLDP